MSYSLRALREYLDGGFPAVIATCAPDGTPNVSALSDVRYVDDAHIALSYQFFNKTRANILTNPHAQLQLAHPHHGARFVLRIRYLRTETSGALFAAMQAKLAGIAAYTGMSKVFRLRGADVYEVLGIEQVTGGDVVGASDSVLLAGVRDALRRLAAVGDIARLIETTGTILGTDLGFEHWMLMLTDEQQRRLYTVASDGYGSSGIGAEIGVGEGIIGIAARERGVVRIAHAAQDYLYSDAVRAGFIAAHLDLELEQRIALPNLAASRSQVALPLVADARVLGVIYAESARDAAIGYAHEDALAIVADAWVAAYRGLQPADSDSATDEMATALAATSGAALVVRHDPRDHSLFVDNEYLIKGVAGAILWRMFQAYVSVGRHTFTNRELRRDKALGLPDIVDNLEARLVLLEKRLGERLPAVVLSKVGRGRYHLHVSRPLELLE